ncbi:hypothetical protein ASD64_11465 [Mesorhizobium sp. Root157]|uniref:hypothetical protein n=1 Tax=Mesorhizobium sp. Root157 TaxID=1736477 RepID=UPI0006FC5181|nr:hypothetical protein [Mesorhizobium sp. Root157]KQZ80901.1 hypothetical protein ASD64_11465 [Mesorhizobium sp. Root157]
MPNIIVPASGEALPKIAFDRAAIMNEAHRYARMYAGREWSYSKLISWGLKAAWKQAKDGTTPAQRRAEGIRAEIDALQYKSLRYDTVAMRRRLETQLAALAA